MEDYIPELEMKDGRVNCWYELSWDREEAKIILRIHKDFPRDKFFFTRSSPLIRGLSAEIKNPNFSGDLLRGFGFGGFWPALKSRGFVGDFIELEIPIPMAEFPNCFFCGRDSLCDFHSNRSIMASWRYARNISASLTAIFTLLSVCDVQTSCDLPQLMIVNTIVKSGFHGGSLDCLLSRDAVDWLSSFPEEIEIKSVVDAMMCAYNMMSGPDIYFVKFKANIYRQGRISLSCPGDACDLSPECHAESDRGYFLYPHNVDTPFQQITLLVGLAALHDEIRDWQQNKIDRIKN